MKRCPDPGHAGPNPLPLSEFGRDLRTPDGVRYRCRGCEQKADHRRYLDGREDWQERDQQRYQMARGAVLDHYGRVCACCGSTTRLTIDHVNGDGREHRAAIKRAPIYRWLVAHGFPDGFQTLCFPCNRSKSDGDRCRLNHPRTATETPWPGLAGMSTTTAPAPMRTAPGSRAGSTRRATGTAGRSGRRRATPPATRTGTPRATPPGQLLAADGGLVLAIAHGTARPVPLILLALGLAAVYALACLARPLRRCPRCKGRRVIERGGRHQPCPRCRATGRTRRLGATAVHKFYWSARGERRARNNEETP